MNLFLRIESAKVVIYFEKIAIFAAQKSYSHA